MGFSMILHQPVQRKLDLCVVSVIHPRHSLLDLMETLDPAAINTVQGAAHIHVSWQTISGYTAIIEFKGQRCPSEPPSNFMPRPATMLHTDQATTTPTMTAFQ